MSEAAVHVAREADASVAVSVVSDDSDDRRLGDQDCSETAGRCGAKDRRETPKSTADAGPRASSCLC